MSPRYENPGVHAWSLAYCAASDLIERATERANHDIRRLATHALAKSFLPAAALVVALGGSTFAIVRDDDTDEEAAVAQTWANEVVRETIAALVRLPAEQRDDKETNLPPDVRRDVDAGNF